MRDYDLFIVGGGINGAGIARDAAGRGLRVGLAEQNDFGGATSSASTKLIHGGLRYLEHREFRLVAESLAEREVLLRIAPHLIKPLQFVLPHREGLRPAWMIRAGLWFYDRLGGRSSLPGSRKVELEPRGYGAGLDDYLTHGFTYWDAWADDARLVIANLRSAATHGADLMPRTEFLAADAVDDRWTIRLRRADGVEATCRARVLVNAAGPWVANVLHGAIENAAAPVRLVKGSHIVVPRVHEGGHAYILQNADRRVLFILPFEGDFSLIGTTESVVQKPEAGQGASAEEIQYLIDAANRYLLRPLRSDDVCWSYSGVRSLYEDGRANASAVTRDYHLKLVLSAGVPLLNVYGGKITTYRKLAEAVLLKLQPQLKTQPDFRRGPWTATEPLPGGDFPRREREQVRGDLRARYPKLPLGLIAALFGRHGTQIVRVLENVQTVEDLGRDFGGGLYEKEVRHFVAEEWAAAAEDILWRRSKTGLHMSAGERAAFANWFADEFVNAGKLE